jgi:hypothetical protein
MDRGIGALMETSTEIAICTLTGAGMRNKCILGCGVHNAKLEEKTIDANMKPTRYPT